MKKLLLFGLLLSGLSAQAQSEKPEGVGKFKIGKTTLSIISELEAELATKTKQVSTYSEINAEKENRAVLELIPDNNSTYSASIYASSCQAAKVYLLPKYVVADIPLTQVKLKFYNGVLIDFTCDEPTKLAEAFAVKYGQGRSEYKERPIACTLKPTGTSITRMGQIATRSWGSESLPAKYVVSKYYNSSCEEKYTSFFTIYDASAVKKLSACEKEADENREKASNAEKKKKLGDL